MRIFTITAITLLGAASGCSIASHEEDQRTVVATVHGTPLYLDELQRELARIRLDEDPTPVSPRGREAQVRKLLDDLIDRRLLLREAESTNVIVGMDEVETAYQRAHRGWQDADFAAQLSEKDLTPAELKRELRDTLTIQKYFRTEVFARIAVTDQQIQTYLDQHPEKVLAPEQVRASQIVVKDRKDAEELLDKIRQGASFEDLAIKHSLSPEGQSGGDLGWFPRGVMPAVFDEVCFALQPGQVSEVVSSDYGFHIFKVVDRRPARERPADEIRDEIEEILRRDREREVQDKKLEDLRRAANIKIEEDILARLN